MYIVQGIRLCSSYRLYRWCLLLTWCGQRFSVDGTQDNLDVVKLQCNGIENVNDLQGEDYIDNANVDSANHIGNADSADNDDSVDGAAGVDRADDEIDADGIDDTHGLEGEACVGDVDGANGEGNVDDRWFIDGPDGVDSVDEVVMKRV